MKKVILMSISTVLLSGCATLINGRYQQLSIHTQPSAASCLLSNDKGRWSVAATPGVIKVHRSSNDLHVACQKAGYGTGIQVVQSHIKGAMLGNVIAGGLVGAGVDDVDGAGFGYPSNILITLPSQRGN